MCVAIPLKIKEISGNDGICEHGGICRSVRLDFIRDPRPGEFVIVHAGFAIERLKESEALETLAIFRELESL